MTDQTTGTAFRLTMLIGLAFGICAATATIPAAAAMTPTAVADKALEQEYRQTWQPRESRATDVKSRTELAEQLLEIAQNASDSQTMVFYARKAYENGRRYLGPGYQVAADALDLIQRTDPSQRLWSLEQLEDLYARFYRARSTLLPAGTAQAEVLEQIATERQDRLAAMMDGRQFDPEGAFQLINGAVRDIAKASTVLSHVIRRAESDGRLVASRYPERSRRLLNYAAKIKTLRDRYNRQRQALEQQRQTLAGLRVVFQRFQRSANPATAASLAAVLVSELDRPELLPTEALRHLNQADRRILSLSCKAPADLTAEQLSALATWYRGKAQEARSPAGQENCLIRALLYSRQAAGGTALGAQAVGQKVVGPASARLTDEQITLATDTLAARLTYLFGRHETLAMNQSAADPSDASVVTTPATDPAPAGDTVATATRSDHTNPADPASGTTEHPADTIRLPRSTDSTPAAVATTTTTSSSSAGGRPLATCQSCGRQFFPGWGSEKQTRCPYCRSGRKNIFDMQANSQME